VSTALAGLQNKDGLGDMTGTVQAAVQPVREAPTLQQSNGMLSQARVLPSSFRICVLLRPCTGSTISTRS